LIDRYASQYEKRKTENPKDEDLVKEINAYEKFPQHHLLWFITKETNTLRVLLTCLQSYDSSTDELLIKMSKLSNPPIAAIAQKEIEKREQINKRKEQRKKLWNKLRRMLFLK
jgi:hypothetical protein